MCGSHHHAPLPLHPHIHRCRKCKHLFVTPRPTQTAIAASYDLKSGPHHVWERERGGRETMWRKRVQRVTRLKPDGGRALDVGTGFGDFMRHLQEVGRWQVEGTEVSVNAAQYASDEHGLSVHRGQVEQVAFPANSFDLITLWHVLEHLPYPGTTLDHLQRLLRPGGLLVVAVPNDGIWPRLVQLHIKDILKRPLLKILRRPYRSSVSAYFGEPALEQEIHLSFFSSRRLISAMRQRDLSVIVSAIDDLSPQPTTSTDRIHGILEVMRKITGTNFSRTIFLAAIKSSSELSR